MVRSEPVWNAVGVTCDGERDIPGLWTADNEGATFGLAVRNEPRNRGVQDILIAIVGGWKGVAKAIQRGLSRIPRFRPASFV